MDPNNPIVKLCAAGMAAEGEGRREDAKALFEQAWTQSSNDFEACIAAHYVARHQATPDDELHWNREALARADAARDEGVREFYPSLYLNLAHSLEQLGHRSEAREHYAQAAAKLADLPDGPYAGLVRKGIAAGLERTRELPLSAPADESPRGRESAQ
jgi:tetratricopeptide (TPR) repeat protein